MKEHPIPQDVTGYRFHIIGNMTLKQFAEIAAGFVVAGILYKIGLPNYLKYPLMIFSAGLGALAAFIPIEDRPLDHWIVTFFQVLFRPTQFYWKRVSFVPAVFAFQSSQPQINPDDEVDLNPARRERIREFMASINPSQDAPNDLTQQETLRLSSVLQYFYDPTTNSLLPQTTRLLNIKPTLTVRVRKLHQESSDETHPDATKQPPLTPAKDTVLPQSQAAILTAAGAELTTSSQTTAPTQMGAGPTTELSVIQPLNPTIISIPNHSIPDPIGSSNPSSESTTDVSLVVAPAPASKTPQQAQSGTKFNSNLPFPTTPTEPNKLVGMVLSASGELVPGAIIEVIDSGGEVARAVKSNALGQFFITTPLSNGSYIIRVDKDDLQFATQQLEVHDVVLNPIELRALSG